MEKIFSDSWHKVSDLKVSLLHNIDIQKQIYRGEQWYVLRDNLNNTFFRIKPEAYKFISGLNTKQTIEEYWLDSLEHQVDTTPTQDEVVHILSQLHGANLLYFKNSADSQKIFEKYTDKKTKELKTKLASFLFIRIPLWDPEKWLESIKGTIEQIISVKGLILWLGLFIYALTIVVENFDKLSSEVEGVLAPSNLFLLYISLAVLKLFHEFGHGAVVKRFGGSVNTFGVMFLVFTPLPYMDASSSWFFKNKWHRALVGSAGMIFELFFASIAAIIWVNTGDGIIHSICFNIMIIGSVSSLIFNGNPLLRFDAYYILSDILEIPNLYKRSTKQVYYLVQKYIFKLRDSVSYAKSKKEHFWLVSYAVLSSIYRIFVSIAIAMFVADQWFLLGVLVFVMAMMLWVLKPLYSLCKYLLFNMQLRTNRLRAITISSLFIGTLYILLFMIPVTNSIKLPGIVYQEGYSNVYAPTGGYLKEIYFKNGQDVKKGDLIAKLENKELDYSIIEINSQIEQTKALYLKAHKNSISDIKPIKKRLKKLKSQLDRIKKQKKELHIYAKSSGRFTSNDIEHYIGTWYKQRQSLGTIVPNGKSTFVAVAMQEQAFDLFDKNLKNGEIKLHGMSHITMDFESVKLIPFQKNSLPSASLGWFGGGDIAVSNEGNGEKTLEYFFEIKGEVKKTEQKISPLLLHGRKGIARFPLPSLPIGVQMVQSIEQIIQKRYKI